MPRDIAIQQGGRERILRESLYRVLAEAAAAGNRGGAVLDVGCGRGEVMAALQAHGLTPVGVDPEPECVSASARFGEARRGGFEDLQRLFGERRFDCLVCSHVLEHLEQPAQALARMRALQADRYVFAVPNLLRPARIVRALLGRRRGDHPHHLYGWGHAEFERLLEECGFSVVDWHQDRVTFMPLGGRLGAGIGRVLQWLEERWLTRLFPMLSSSLIVACVPRRNVSGAG